mmetsp:Transcript_41203/g.68543  ORF Transcript_41203/g.68543 Transcript_41203/m.68543 type:complete len:413 (+) Transcript_41203:110-1348(+)|eukprot:CAMPEP_0119323758 /NCGR_PEP_ID=MMETSP1333-20130426/61527_1 /TAXON_ID=418940 /ORGANISM="Scyphosphaera apsteinii, Strain RCC1455" /LENGTH=412 /DNA_ID=CAMNT_0007331289 /DNA_START=106 /DNA_END=1344 /DNA_ORIENTATION=+
MPSQCLAPSLEALFGNYLGSVKVTFSSNEKTASGEWETAEATVPLHALSTTLSMPIPPLRQLAVVLAGDKRLSIASQQLRRAHSNLLHSSPLDVSQLLHLGANINGYRDIEEGFQRSDHALTCSGRYETPETCPNTSTSMDIIAALDQYEQLLRPFVDLLREARAAPLLNCSVDCVLCPTWNWYIRALGAGAFRAVHNDGGFMSDARSHEIEFNSVFGTKMNSWINIWTLLSDGEVFEREPIVLFPPSHHHTFYWPPPTPEEGLRSLTADGMKPGDSLVWRSTKMPHGKAVRVSWSKHDRATTVLSHETSTTHGGHRTSSVDIRCVCTKRQCTKRQYTKSGGICRQLWRVQDSEEWQHGCSNPNDDPLGPWCILKQSAGVKHRVMNGHECSHARLTPNGRPCAPLYWDYCTL